MEALEPEARRRARLVMQLKALESAKFDVGLFQEVNPLLERTSQIEAQLQLTGCFQSDLVGVKVLGMGIPNNLNSGLLTVAADKYQLRRVGGFKLSGIGRSFVSPWLSFQLKEERYALFCELIHPDWGRVLVVNTHLHHGLELNDSLEKIIKEKIKEFDLSASVETEIFERLHQGNHRRLKEMKRLIDEIERLQGRYSLVILGGDFNESAEGQVGQLLKECGFKDSFDFQTEHKVLNTFDREHNLANHKLQARFPLSVQFQDLSFSKKVTLSLREILTSQEQRPRRIDQIWVKAKGKSFKTQVELIGLEEEVGFAPSDHFGYLISLEEKG